MELVNLESFFMDIMDEVFEYMPDSDHSELLGLILQKLHDGGYDLTVLYDNNEILDTELNIIYGNNNEKDDYCV